MVRAAAPLALLLLAAPAAAERQHYELDPVHTRVLVAVSHAGFSQALGTISGSTGELDFDPDDWTTARLEATVPVHRLDFGDADWNAAALGRRLLDADDHPQARFVSTTVTPRDERHAQVCGDFILRGVTAPLCLEVTLNAQERHPMPPFRRTIGFSATGSLERGDFGIDAWRAVIGQTVELRIEAEAIARRDDDDGDEAVDPRDEAASEIAPATDKPAPDEAPVPSEPTDPADPADPTDSTSPIDPADPADSTEQPPRPR
jgi:polyisoprenoid-binding protein YceI